MSDETEIKLAIQGEGLAAAEALFAQDPPIAVESTYFDTPDLLLRRHGIQVRLRRDGPALLQTVKLPDGDGGALTRAEHEIPIRTPRLKRDHLLAVAPEDLRDEIAASELSAVFTTRFTRRRHRAGEGEVAELAFDRGEIVHGAEKVPICEVEVELKGENIGAFVAVVLDFLDRVPASLIASGKAARGYRLVSGEAPAAVHARKLSLPPRMLLPDAIRLMLRHGFTQFLNNVPAAHAGLPDGLHQIRVALRRLRSTISAFAPVMDTTDAARLLEGIKQLFATFGAVREADVFVADTLPQLVKAGMKPSLAELVEEEAARCRRAGQEKVVAQLESPDTARLVIELYGWIEAGSWLKSGTPLDKLLARRPVADFAAPRLRKLHKRLLKKGRAARQSVVLDEWHEARIAAKKLRYAAEPLLSTLDLPAELADSYRKTVEAIQSELGRLNDLHVAEAFLERLVQEAAPQRRRPLKRALAVLHDWRHSAEDSFIVEAARAFRQFEKAGFPLRKRTGEE
ncbi:CHAD domain-containing protein [Rhodoligotrophos defluvii]|uniref:CYTH and CHAD domain-containing protein n=1 Tax=Rhodoligotrophos defluvii TaxID=2561934 RepID=UPI0010C955DD|nr:CHAD domain-containing protein [Rhodoligotrophos defluvii]